MCGLYSLRRTPAETRTLFNYVDQPDFPPRPYVAPGGPMAIVRLEEGQRRFALVRWGFIPSWTREIKPGKPLINARGETVADKPSFRNAFRRRRCLVPADGFYEWRGDIPGKKQPFLFRRPDQGLFAFAGLWEHWAGADGSELETGLIITTSPNRVAAPIHDRMPVIIAPEDHETWLSGEPGAALSLIRPAPDELLIAEETRIERAAPVRSAAPAGGQGSLL